jgi:hypothetical protein
VHPFGEDAAPFDMTILDSLRSPRARRGDAGMGRLGTGGFWTRSARREPDAGTRGWGDSGQEDSGLVPLAEMRVPASLCRDAASRPDWALGEEAEAAAPTAYWDVRRGAGRRRLTKIQGPRLAAHDRKEGGRFLILLGQGRQAKSLRWPQAGRRGKLASQSRPDGDGKRGPKGSAALGFIALPDFLEAR